jgi:hypothetical protein
VILNDYSIILKLGTVSNSGICFVHCKLLIPFVTEWEALFKEDGLQDTINEITQFWKGKYEDADPDVQRKWCHVMLHFLPCVCSSYHKWEIKKNTPISQVTHATDEALVTWFLLCYISDWDKLYEDRLQVQDTD